VPQQESFPFVSWFSVMSDDVSALPKEVAALSESKLRHFREAFAVFDPANDSFIGRADVPLALRSLSLHPTPSELKAHLDELVPGQPRVDFIAFARIASRLLNNIDNVPAMTRLFALWDPSGTGTVTVSPLQRPPLPPRTAHTRYTLHATRYADAAFATFRKSHARCPHPLSAPPNIACAVHPLS
jgi:Ca2+-binding EF-hand superfamily protein